MAANLNRATRRGKDRRPTLVIAGDQDLIADPPLPESIMPKATCTGAVLADAPADAVEIVERNVYFPIDAVRTEYLRASETHTVCGWKGTASYYDVVVNGQVNKDAAWYYPEPKEAASQIAGRVAFWRGVTVDE
jgi:uncharacterized protein (DUF427 family)